MTAHTRVQKTTNAFGDVQYQRVAKVPMLLNLVAEGGGVKGLSYAGAWIALNRAHPELVTSIQRVAGSSAGGIFALLVALEYSADEILDEMYHLDFTQFQDRVSFTGWMRPFNLLPEGNTKDALRALFSSKHGAYKGEVFKAWIQGKIAAKLDNPEATFADLQAKVDEENSLFKELYVTGTDLNNGQSRTLSFKTKPNMPLWLAVRITMSFPGAFEMVDYVDITDNNVDDYVVVTKDEMHMVDGGAANNDPTNVFESSEYVESGYKLDQRGGNPCTLNIRVDSEAEINQLWKPYNKLYDPTSTTDYLKGLMESMTNGTAQLDRIAMNTIQIPDQGVSSLDFGLTPKEKRDLIDAGRKTALAWVLHYRHGAAYDITTFDDLESLYESYTLLQLRDEQMRLINLSSDNQQDPQQVALANECLGVISNLLAPPVPSAPPADEHEDSDALFPSWAHLPSPFNWFGQGKGSSSKTVEAGPEEPTVTMGCVGAQ